ncbi:MAG: DNA modification methylase [Desulfobulbaceae bacterium]|nr:DNA modification methylase [Desulfobulbaceae bacterium]
MMSDLPLAIELWSIDRLQESPNSARKNDHAVSSMADAIQRFGFRIPILARSSGEIIDGHLRLKAARQLDMASVPVLLADDMSEMEIRAFRISVNKVAELANWDMKLLGQELRGLLEVDFDLGALGFSEVELDDILNPALAAGAVDPDAVPDLEDPVSREGDLWLLGDHRLLVGDSRIEENYRRLLEGQLVDLVWTDPPYNVDYSGKAGSIQNDKMSEAEFCAFLADFYRNSFSFLKKGGAIYVAHADGEPSFAFRNEFRAAGFKYSTCLIWRKSQATIGRADYHYQHEPILYGWKPGAGHCWYGGRKRRSIVEFGDPPLFTQQPDGSWLLRYGDEILMVTGTNVSVTSFMPTIVSVDKPARSELHPTMKPVALIEWFVLNSSCPGDIVLDAFCGSGSTLIACERRRRRCRALELDPRFADVIVRRWQDFTKKVAVMADGFSFDEIKEFRLAHAE